MRKNAGSRAVSTNLDNLLIAIILISVFCLGFLNFLTKFNIVYPTIEASSEFNNYDVNNTNFGVNQTYPSGIIIDTYYQVKIGDIIKPVMISSYGNQVSGLSYDDEENSIILLLNPLTSKGNNMWVDIPRDILDSKLNGNDKNFTVMIDDKPAKFLEITNNSKVNSVSNRHLDNISKIQYSNNTDTRELMIEYGADSKIIKISGTDTNNLSNKSQGIDTERDKTTKDRYGQQDIFFPIIYIIMAAAGIAIFYLLYRKNKNLLMRKTRSR